MRADTKTTTARTKDSKNGSAAPRAPAAAACSCCASRAANERAMGASVPRRFKSSTRRHAHMNKRQTNKKHVPDRCTRRAPTRTSSCACPHEVCTCPMASSRRDLHSPPVNVNELCVPARSLVCKKPPAARSTQSGGHAPDMSGFRVLNSGSTATSGIRAPTTHVSPPSAHCAPVSVPSCPSAPVPLQGAHKNVSSCPTNTSSRIQVLHVRTHRHTHKYTQAQAHTKHTTFIKPPSRTAHHRNMIFPKSWIQAVNTNHSCERGVNAA